jgi:hypothetical protein
MLLANECYAAPLIFVGDKIYQDEVLARRHFCRKRDESAAEVQPTDVGFLLKRLFIIPTAVNQDRQLLYQVRERSGIAQDSSSEHAAVKTTTAAFAPERPHE